MACLNFFNWIFVEKNIDNILHVRIESDDKLNNDTEIPFLSNIDLKKVLKRL